MFLVDTSVWVLASVRPQLLADYTGEHDVAVCPPVVQEVLQGERPGRPYAEMRETLLDTTMLDAPVPFERFEEAAQLYAQCRIAGYTIRSAYDCLIAACAIAHDVPLLHLDVDFEHIARVVPLKQSRLPLP